MEDITYTDNGRADDGNFNEIGNSTSEVAQELEEWVALLFDQLVTTKGLAAAEDLLIGQTSERISTEKGLELGRDFINVLVVGLLFNLDIADLLFVVARSVLDLLLFAHDELGVRVA